MTFMGGGGKRSVILAAAAESCPLLRLAARGRGTGWGRCWIDGRNEHWVGGAAAEANRTVRSALAALAQAPPPSTLAVEGAAVGARGFCLQNLQPAMQAAIYATG